MRPTGAEESGRYLCPLEYNGIFRLFPFALKVSSLKRGYLMKIQGTKGVISTGDYLDKIKTALSGVSSQERTASDYLASPSGMALLAIS